MQSALPALDAPHTTPVVETVDPAAPSTVVTRYAPDTAHTVRSAIDAAADAAARWAALPAPRRAALLAGLADVIRDRCDAAAALITAEEGKTLAAALAETGKAAEQFRFSAQLAYHAEGTTFPAEVPDSFAYTLRSPLGLVAAVTPWNFPLSLAARKVAPALAAGNAVLLKPSPVTAGVGAWLAEAAVDAGVPAGVLSLVQGEDPAALAALLAADEVRAVSFTGSDLVGEHIRRRAPHARLQLELGGHNAAVVAADADLDAAAARVSGGAFDLTGQACTATDRVLVARPVLAEFTARLADRVRALRVGPGTHPDSTAGPVATSGQFVRLTALRQSALSAGSSIVAEGELLDDRDPDGRWIVPTLFADVPAGHDLLEREVFGPYLSIVPVDSPEDAIAMINASRYGLVTALHTRDLALAHRFARDVTCGLVKINDRTTGNGVAPPFGGWKASSGGAFPEGGRQALDFVTDTKTVYLTPS